jgi:hypothetical protein
MRTKGQAAMEFLMTYGWAILAAIIVIGVLAIYFRPSALTPNQAVLGAPLYANAWSITPSNVQLEVQNQAGEPINITFANATIDSPTGVVCTATTPNVIVTESALQGVTIACSGSNWIAGTSIEGTLTVRYTRGGGTTPLTSTGSISGTIA